MADPGEWRGRVLDSQWVKAREGQPLLTSVTMLRWKYDILLDRPLLKETEELVQLLLLAGRKFGAPFSYAGAQLCELLASEAGLHDV
jgi:hypothetical protein